MNASESQHLRINERLEAYWEGLRGARAMPLESDVSMEELKDIWDHCFVVSVRKNGFAYDYLGPALIDAYGDNLTGREITESLLYPHPTSLFRMFEQVTKSGQPGLDESQFTNTLGASVKYRSCVLPLGAHDQVGVAFLLGGMKWKAY